ncbi:cutinase family protein [Nocardia higoensis]|uniref:Cutinase family protein n=2 Tax=Nocardia higoensis TaxID=228599 RepID=A0ABS0DGP4_9NOCA|nr:cutinase family protein [Nocardia higoensis]
MLSRWTLSRWTNATVCTLAMVAAVLPMSAGAVGAAPGSCPDLHVVVVPGTWETSHAEPGKGILAGAADGLPGNVRVDYVTYAATAFPWEGEVYGRSKREATDGARGLVADVARQCAGTRFALLGYSQGADAAGDLAAEIGTGLGVVPPDRVGLVGLVADPRRSPTDQLIGPAVPGAGAGGPRLGGFGWLSPVAYTFCVPEDLYCATPDGDFAARIAGLFAQASDPSQFYQLPAGDLLADVVNAGGLGLLHDQLNNSAYEQRKRQIDNFLSSGAHQSYPYYRVAGGETVIGWLRGRLRALT